MQYVNGEQRRQTPDTAQIMQAQVWHDPFYLSTYVGPSYWQWKHFTFIGIDAVVMITLLSNFYFFLLPLVATTRGSS